MPELDSIVQTADEVPGVTRVGAYHLAGPRRQTAVLHSISSVRHLQERKIAERRLAR